jgi:hypothetical protein
MKDIMKDNPETLHITHSTRQPPGGYSVMKEIMKDK